MGDNRPIGVFDSGIGGLTVVHELFNHLPNESIVYFGDTARVPYGSKSPDVVKKFGLQDILFLLGKNVKLVIAACHTVSSIALDELNQIFHLPILGVVEPGVKAAAKATKNGKIGVIGTRGTVSSRAYETKLAKISADIQVFPQACPLFVPLAEEGWLDNEITRSIARIYLDPLKEKGIDTLILGCTHYPLLKKIIAEVLGPDVTIIDSAEETAKLVARRLSLLNLEREENGSVQHKFFVSDIPHQFREIGERFLGTDLGNVTRIDIEGEMSDTASDALKIVPPIK
ncbi:glutamate racemase [candidate division KSB1 bacterium]|nr:MAG: glutamate racemase [candidate division KSB1 bacterium]